MRAAYVLASWATPSTRLTARYDYFVFESKRTSTYQPPVGLAEFDYFTDRTGSLTGGIGLITLAFRMRALAREQRFRPPVQ